MMKNKKVLILLSLIILLGIFLRVYNIDEESFWIDEAATVYTTQQSPSDIIQDIYVTTKHAPEYYDSGGTPPFYFLVANYWTQFMGLSEAKLRLLSAIFGTISIFMIFIIGRMLFNSNVGLVAAFIMSINFMHINYSQEARTYSLIIFLALLTVYFLLSALRQHKVIYWFGYVLSATLLIYSHYFGFFILAFEGLYLLLFWKTYKDSLSKAMISAVGIFALYVPWIPALIRQIVDSKLLGIFLGQNILIDLARIFVQFNSWFVPDQQTRIALRDLYSSMQNFSTTNFHNVSFLSWATVISVLGLTLLLGLYFLLPISNKNNRLTSIYFKDKNYIFLLMWFIIPIGIAILLTLIVQTSPIFGFVQHVLYVTPAYYILAANGILKSKKYPIVLALVVVLSILPLQSYYSNFDKEQWKETTQYLSANRLPGELVAVHMRSNILVIKYYYNDMDRVVPVMDVDELKLKIKNEKSVWLIYASEKFFDPQLTIKNYLDTNFKLDKNIEFTGIKIFHYTK